MATLQELEARLDSIRSRLAEIDDIQDPGELDLNEQETLIAEYDAVSPKADELRKRNAALDRIRRDAAEPDNRETPAEAPTMFVRSNPDPFADEERVHRNLVARDELRARAERLIELDQKSQQFYGLDTPLAARSMTPDEQAEIAYKRSQSSPQIARHLLMTGTREYREAFRSYLENPFDGSIDTYIRNGSYRAINLANTGGGYLLPYVLDPSIVLTNNASANPFRRVSRVVQTTSNAWQGVNSAGVTAAWVAEATTAADASPSVGQIQIFPQKGAAWVFGSYEALDDTDFGQQLPGLLADAKDRLESAAFATGSGTAQPLGVVAALGAGSRVAPGATGTAFQGTTGTGGYQDVLNLQAALPPRFRNAAGAAFMGSITTLNRVRGLDQYGGGAFWTNLTSNTPPALLGQPVYEASDMNATMTGAAGATGTGSATLMFGDFGQFIIADRVGVSMLYDPMLKGTGANAQLPTGQAGWYLFWRTSSAVSTTAAFRYLTIS